MKFAKMNPVFLSDGIRVGNEFDPDDRNQAIYVGLDDNGFEMKRDFVKDKMSDPYTPYDATTYFIPGNVFMFKVMDDDENVIGYYVLNDWNRDLQASENEKASRINKAFAYCDEVEGLDDSKKLMFLMNRLINALSVCEDEVVDEASIPFDEVKVASCGAFPKSAYNASNSDFDRKLFILEDKK